MNFFEGKTAEVLFETGYHFKLEYLQNNRLKWTSLKEDNCGENETEDIWVHEQGAGIFTVVWRESTGFAVTHNIDLNKGTVWAFMTWNDADAYGGRATLAHKGTYKFL